MNKRQGYEGYGALLLTTVLLSAAAWAGSASVHVTAAWTRPTPEGLGIAVGYMTLTNTGAKPVRLMTITSAIASHVEVHESRVQEGMAHMTETVLQIEAGQQRRLQPGGVHLMLMGLSRPLRLDEEVPLEMTFSDGQVLRTALRVRPEPVQ